MSFSTRLQPSQTQVFRMGHVVNLLQMSGEELDQHLLQSARDNPFLVVRRRRAAAAVSSTQAMLTTEQADAPTSLYDHVLRELAGLIGHGGAMERLVVALIEELEPTGWLGRDVAEIAAELRLPEDLVEKGLKLVQKRVTPAGLFARSLSECLRLQLEDQDSWDSAAEAVLTHLDRLAQGGVAGVAAATGLDREIVARHLARLRRLDPKPGARFSTDLTLLREPDVRVEPRGEGWVAIVKSAYETQVSLVPEAARGASPEMQEALKQARALKQALDLRQSALKQVMRCMIQIQADYFREGPEALRPLSQVMIAEKTGFHLSTVSRVLNGLLVQGPHGIFEARLLCARAASRAAKDGPAKPRVLSQIKAALLAESPTRPLSDQHLSDLLRADGMIVSRRVVAKYRHELGFAPAAQRRLRA